jgi:alkylated DNA repair dioxygenase AlkB
MTVPGLLLFENFITETEETQLLKYIDESEWKDNRQGTRKVQIYGPWHNSSYRIIPGKVSDHPQFLKDLANKLYDFVNDINKSKLVNQNVCEVYINEYLDKDSLQYHFDHPGTYDENIYGISLCNDAFMGFKNSSNLNKVLVPKRSLYVMSGESRYKYMHGIDKGWITGRRVSITFRTVKK